MRTAGLDMLTAHLAFAVPLKNRVALIQLSPNK